MAAIQRMYPGAKPKMSVSPVQWLPGALSAMLPFFACNPATPNTLFLRADDPNLYGIVYSGGQQNPVVEKNHIQKPANKGCNFYSAPWCINTFPARDLGLRVEIKAIDPSVFSYITALYKLIGTVSINLTNWRLENPGYVKQYQLVQGSQYVNVGGTTYFGGQTVNNTATNGVGEFTEVTTNLISNDFTYNGPTIPAYQLPYNTFYAVDTPIVISAVDTAAADPAKRIYFTLQNNVTIYNGPNYSQS
jgi:hypothetical protein